MKMTPDDIAKVAYQAGFRGQALAWMTAIAQRESKGETAAYNPNVHTGDQSWGLWQINTLGPLGPARSKMLQDMGYSGDLNQLLDPVVNARMAYKLSAGGTNFEPWRSASPGWGGPQGFLTDATQYLPEATSAAARVGMGKASQITSLLSNTNSNSAYGNMVGWLNQQIGKPYRFGAKGADSFDCSGLVAAMYDQLGIHLPALTFTMKDYGVPVTASQLQPGDMMFKHGAQGDWGHVGVYVGNNTVIAAPHTGAFVQRESLANWSDVNGIRRIVDAQGRLITGGGNLLAPHDQTVSTVPLSQAAMTPGNQQQFGNIQQQPSNQPPPMRPFTLPTHDFDTVLAGEGTKVRSLV